MSDHNGRTPAEGAFLVVLATRNPDKIREITAILRDARVEVADPADLPRWDEPLEDGETLEDNAYIKAKAVYDATGVPSVADDTGLEVDAIGGAPGVRSSRYSGEGATYESNCAKLLSDLGETSARSARFRTVVATAGLDDAGIAGGDFDVDGVLEGEISSERRGSGGFGYDPVFVPNGSDRTLAEMTSDEKNAISHRGRAFRKFAAEFSRRLDAS
ncbi:MAG: non-canonical purine NTP pyrophosphatase, RdgB/HAM1 family [Acidobacteria bacterium]|nr:MAG: non-canonical purine NTP pyrophosphatase, RdgB/HAM1 family [Acidobacteriota bacterium]